MPQNRKRTLGLLTCNYEFQAVAICPVDGSHDVYTVTVRTSATRMVEDLLAAVRRCNTEPITQEDFTEKLHRELKEEVSTVGMHSGVRTTVRCA